MHSSAFSQQIDRQLVLQARVNYYIVMSNHSFVAVSDSADSSHHAPDTRNFQLTSILLCPPHHILTPNIPPLANDSGMLWYRRKSYDIRKTNYCGFGSHNFATSRTPRCEPLCSFQKPRQKLTARQGYHAANRYAAAINSPLLSLRC